MHDSSFGSMPADTEPDCHERSQLGDRDALNEAVLVAEVSVEALDVGEVHELRGPERLGERPCRGVGVEVVGPAVLTPGQGRHDGHVSLGLQRDDQPGIDRRHFADETEPGVLGTGDERCWRRAR